MTVRQMVRMKAEEAQKKYGFNKTYIWQPDHPVEVVQWLEDGFIDNAGHIVCSSAIGIFVPIDDSRAEQIKAIESGVRPVHNKLIVPN